MATTIITKNGSGAPLAGDLTAGELAVDLTNKRLYSKDSGGNVIELGTTPSGISGGTIDDTVIGGTTPAAGTFTSLTATGDLTVDTDTLYVDSTNNRVGIGTTNPSGIGGGADLAVNKSGGARFVLNNNSRQWAIRGDSGSDDLRITARASSDTVDADYLTITSGGDVGIGTTSPSSNLHVYNGADAEEQVIIGEVSGGYSNAAGISLRRSGTEMGRINASYFDGMTFHATTGSGGAATERMRIDASGNVGIGSTAPTYAKTVIQQNAVGESVILALDNFESGTGNEAVLSMGRSNTANRRVKIRAVGTGNNFVNPELAFDVNESEAMRIDSSGNLLVGDTVASAKITSKGSSNGSTTYSLFCRNSDSTQTFYVRDDGIIGTGQDGNSPYYYTTATAANLVVQSSGVLARSTSSARYKENIRDYDQAASIDALRPVFFNSKNEGDNKTYAGLIAEEVHEAGFTEFVEYNDAGEPDAVFYANMVALCIKEIQDLKAEVAALKEAN